MITINYDFNYICDVILRGSDLEFATISSVESDYISRRG